MNVLYPLAVCLFTHYVDMGTWFTSTCEYIRMAVLLLVLSSTVRMSQPESVGPSRLGDHGRSLN